MPLPLPLPLPLPAALPGWRTLLDSPAVDLPQQCGAWRVRARAPPFCRVLYPAPPAPSPRLRLNAPIWSPSEGVVHPVVPGKRYYSDTPQYPEAAVHPASTL
jgi:hypothetical protein